MRKLFLLAATCLILAATCFDAHAKTYLFDDFYYGMSKQEIKKTVDLYPASSKEQCTAKAPFFAGEYQGMQAFVFDKKERLKEVLLIFNLSEYPDENRPRYLNRRHDACLELTKFINDFATKIFFITHTRCGFLGIDFEEYKQGLRSNYLQYYAIGKNLYHSIIKKNQTVLSFFKAIPKKSRIIEVTYLGDFLMAKFTTFGNVYTNKSNIKNKVERLSRALQ